MITYNLGENITAYTTTREIGRDSRLLCPALGVAEERFARPHQVHGGTVKRIDEGFFDLPPEEQKTFLDGVDAVIYNIRYACIGISTADCIPVVAYDPVKHCAAAIHAGWRGTVQRIAEKTLEKMHEEFGTCFADLHCAIGPGISQQSFEVGDEVFDAFATAGFDMDSIAVRMPRIVNGTVTSEERWHLDIKLCNAMQLTAMGVKQENITISDLDTMTDDRFFSARRDGIKTGRMLSGIVLR